MRRVFVTGVGGFVGSWVARAFLNREDLVVGLIHDEDPNSPLRLQGLSEKIVSVRGDICDVELLKRALNEYQIDIVVHAAAQPLVKVASSAPLETFRVNVLGTASLIEAARTDKYLKCFLYVSTDKVYGTTTSELFSETSSLNPTEPYGASKAAADLLVRSFSGSMPILVTRNCNMYGPYDLSSRIIPNTIRTCVKGLRPKVFTKFLDEKKQYIHVEDAVSTWLALIDRCAFGVFNVCTEELVGQQLVHRIAKYFDLLSVDDDSDVILTGTQAMSSLRLSFLLGNEVPFRSLDSGLSDTVEWWRKFSKTKEGGLII